MDSHASQAPLAETTEAGVSRPSPGSSVLPGRKTLAPRKVGSQVVSLEDWVWTPLHYSAVQLRTTWFVFLTETADRAK